MSNSKKVVLAYSGGLDTSYCVAYLKNELNLEVHTVLVETGGFTQEELDEVEEKALSLGASSHKTIDKVDDFYQQIIRYLVYGNVLKNHTYPLSVSAERVSQAIAVAEYAQQLDADYIAHGSTGAGNDQIRFDLVFNVMVPDLEILTPIRDQKLSREEEVEFLKGYGVDLDWEEAQYSVNKGLWGTTVGGAETLTSHLPLPNDAWPSQLEKNGSEIVELEFDKGEIVGVGGRSMSSVEAIRTLDELGSSYAIGRDVHVGDTIIGIKGRVGFEAAAPLIIINAHRQLEKHTLTKWQLYWKDQLGEWYGQMLHEGQFLDPVMRNIEAFMEDTQEAVSGTVKVSLHPYRYEILGISSDNDLMQSSFGDYGEMNKAWSGDDVKGFSKILSNQINLHRSVHNES
ncbi:argininosuccinate synthase [Aliifodinibius sp. S!AR15-10]|uniref:argininosuccinate synthase n=1 Tax=Aliifodinibius sp. S!AR15-10 TaxID=2950437 RepID=UPI0028679428|nr:argininosuccinate synthase [Aliifodinibius sp. S!AR15-10]MDR8392182.1 argininosuccinate synthase [Aliifodinibius sp. S!AR15-10]